MSGPDRAPSGPFAVSEDPGGPIFWPYGDPANPGAPAAPALESALVNLGFLGSAIRRGKKIWLTMAILGLLIGCGLFASVHLSYSASVSILMSEDPQGEIGGVSTEPLLAKNLKVATAAVKALGLPLTPEAFLGMYSVTVINQSISTDTNDTIDEVNSPVLVIAATAKTAAQAESDANVIAEEFLKFRTQTLQGQVTASDAAAEQQVAEDRTAVASLQARISTVSAEPASTAQQEQLNSLQSEKQTASSTLSAAETTAGSDKAARQLTVSGMISGTQILSSSVAALSSSRAMTAIEYIGSPFVGFLMVGLVIVAVGAVTSDRLRRRDDIAVALGAPVRLSVSAYGGGNRILPRPSAARREAIDVRRIVGYLASVLKAQTHRPITLVIIAVDNGPAVIGLVKALAAALAREGKRVAVADLSDHMLARDLGEGEPGVHKTRVHGVGMLLVVPEMGRELETGPLGRTESSSAAQGAVDVAYASADVFLVVTSLDPARGGSYIATWAREAVVVVTAGASPSVKIQSAGEMLRASGVNVISAIVLGVDKEDDSLGTLERDR